MLRRRLLACRQKSGPARSGLRRAGVAGETWRGSGVQHSFAPDILSSGPIMRVVSRLLQRQHRRTAGVGTFEQGAPIVRSEEHTSELQSLMRSSYAVCCLNKKKAR